MYILQKYRIQPDFYKSLLLLEVLWLGVLLLELAHEKSA